MAETPGLVFQNYEDTKRQYKDTAATCVAAGFNFVPLILEAHGGGWSPLLRSTVDWVSKTQAICHHEDKAAVSLRIAQRISCTLQKENARAILRRSAAVPAPSALPSGWDNVGNGGEVS